MTFDEWFYSTQYTEKVKAVMKNAWEQSQLETMVEIRDWLKQKMTGAPWNDSAMTVLKDIHTVIAANVKRGGEWATSTTND